MSNNKQIKKHIELPHQETIVGINTIQTKPFDNQKITKMSNDKQSMELYTERQMREMFRMGLADSINEDGALNQFAPIELPSDEEIEKGVNCSNLGLRYDYSMSAGFKKGAKWMRDKIQGGNKCNQ